MSRPIFAEFDPPPGGLLRLRQRLRSTPPRRTWIAVAATTAIAVALLVARPDSAPVDRVSTPTPLLDADDHPALALVNGTPAAVSIRGGCNRGRQLPTTNDAVVLFVCDP